MDTLINIAGANDVMQVCRNGHVITDRLQTFPERSLSHCDRCGATTQDRCATCGQNLPGAPHHPGMETMGHRRPPQCCAFCGATFPWANPAPKETAKTGATELLEPWLRRLPLMVRQLRARHAERPPFLVNDEFDLADLLRALLPLHFDDVRLETRTPRYASSSRTDFLIVPETTALLVKRTTPQLRRAELAAQWPEDITYYQAQGKCRTLLGLVYDPEALLIQPRELETAWSQTAGDLTVRCVIVQ